MQFLFGDACFYLNSFSTPTSTVLSTNYAVYITLYNMPYSHTYLMYINLHIMKVKNISPQSS